MWEKIKFIGSAAWDFLQPFIKLLLSQIGPILTQAAMEAVKIAASTDMDNTTKRDFAFGEIKANLTKQGISVLDSVINLAIEAAVTKLKNS
jgi:hypothetical protein